MKNKLLRDFDNGGKGPQVVLRLADLMNFFEANNLPLAYMAQVEIECEWKRGPAAADQLSDLIDSPVVPHKIDLAGATTGLDIAFVEPPVLHVDYLHYNEEENAKTQARIEKGVVMNFTEVVHTNGVNPELGAVADGEHVVASNHIIGMAGKEVKKLYFSFGN